MKPLALVLAPLALVAFAAPAVAQDSPTPTTCPNVAVASTQEQATGPADQPVTLTFYSDVQPAKTPDRWTLTRLSPGPVEVLDVRLSTSTATFTVTASVTSTYRVETSGPDGCAPAHADFTRTVTPSTTATPYQDRECPTPVVNYPRVVDTGKDARISISLPGTSPSASYTVRLNRERPNFAVVRTAQTSATGTVFTVRLGETHDFRAVMTETTGPGAECSFGGGTSGLTIAVRPVLAISAVRNSARDYSFTGRVTPGRGQAVTLYRVNANDSRVLTSRSTVRPDGTYRFDRRFTGSGQFGFVATVGNSATNLAGSSPVRPTVIH